MIIHELILGFRLYINDYNLDSNNAKVQGMVALVKRTNNGTTLIDGIGTQMHLSVSRIENNDME